MPPPTRAKRAMDSAPKEKPARTSRAWATSVYMPVKTMYNVPRPKTANPATPRPMTAPPVNETDKAFAKEVRAACVVRTFALVAIFIPIHPAKALNTAPMIKAMAITQSVCAATASNSADQPNKAAAITTKTPKTRHSARKKANAPREMCPASSTIFSSPASCLLTQMALPIMTTKPKRPSTGTIHSIWFIVI